MISDVPLGAFLSGGIDSSAVVGIMSKFSDRPIKTFSITFEEGAPVNESKYAKFVSDYYNTDHTELFVKSEVDKCLPLLVWHLDDLISDAASIPVYHMARSSRNNITVALTGDGADEVFAGYSIYYTADKIKFSRYLPTFVFDVIKRLYRYIPSLTIRKALAYMNESKTLDDRYLRGLFIMPDIEKNKIVSF